MADEFIDCDVVSVEGCKISDSWGMISGPTYTHTTTTTDTTIWPPSTELSPGIWTTGPKQEWDAEHNAYQHEHDMVTRVNPGTDHPNTEFCLICKRTMPQIVAAELKHGD